MGAPEPMVKGIGLLANLSIFNATVDFESLQELFELLPMIDEVKNGFERNFDMKRIQAQWMNGFEHGVAEFSPLLNMDRDQFRDLYNDFQTTLYGIAKIEAKSTLGFHVCLTMKNAAYPFACKYDECIWLYNIPRSFSPDRFSIRTNMLYSICVPLCLLFVNKLKLCRK